MAPWADVLYACDWQWWNRYHVDTTRCKGERWTCNARAAEEFGLCHVEPLHGGIFHAREGAIHAGKNSGYQAIQLAQLLGAKKIILLGFDFQKTGGKSHWHGDHPHGWANGGDFSAWAHDMAVLADHLQKINVTVLNCSRISALNCFEKVSLEQVERLLCS